MDDARMQVIFDYIEGVEIELDPDPIKRGPKFLNTQVAQCRNLTNEIQKFEREVAREKLQLDRKLNRLESSYELQFNDLLANDPHVLKKTSVRDREAAARTALAAVMSDIVDIKRQVTDLGHVETVIKSKLREMKEVNRDIRLQMRLIEDEIQLGNYWGDQSEDGQHHIQNEEIELEELEPSVGYVVDDATAAQAFDSEFNASGQDEDLDEALDKIMVADPSDHGNISPHGEIDYEDLLEGL